MPLGLPTLRDEGPTTSGGSHGRHHDHIDDVEPVGLGHEDQGIIRTNPWNFIGVNGFYWDLLVIWHVLLGFHRGFVGVNGILEVFYRISWDLWLAVIWFFVTQSHSRFCFFTPKRPKQWFGYV